MSKPAIPITDPARLWRDFLAPGPRDRPATFWFLNHELEAEELQRQLEEQKSAGFGAAFMHARRGLLTPYMSEQWLDMIAAAVAHAREIGLEAWLYDEFDWPSGTCSGMVLEGSPELRGACVKLAAELELEAGVGARVELGDEQLIAAVALDAGGQPNVLSGPDPDAKSFEYEPSAPERLFVFTKSFDTILGRPYIDALNPDAARGFLALTHQAYAGRLAHEFGRTIPGVFTDEPSATFARDRGSFPWTDRLPGAYADRWGRDLFEELPRIFDSGLGGAAPARQRLSETILELYRSGFWAPCAEWCAEHGLLLVGHVNDEGELDRQVWQHRDFFAANESMSWAGVDCLFDNAWPRWDPKKGYKHFTNNLVGPKFAASVAHLLGKPRVLTEAFGCAGGWGLDLSQIRRLADWQLALGLNFFVIHGYYYSLAGPRKWERPPAQSHQVPYWPMYRYFADRLARQCAVMKHGVHRARVAVLYPNRTATAIMDPGPSPRVQDLERTFTGVSSALLKAHWDFDYISEELLAGAELGAGTMIAGAERFDILVLPGCRFIGDRGWEAVKAFHAGGGRVLFVNDKPEHILTHDELIPVADQVGDMLETSNAAHMAGRGSLESAGFADRLGALLESWVEPGVRIRSRTPDLGRAVICHHRSMAGIEVFMLANTDPDMEGPVTADLGASGVPLLLDPDTGRIMRMAGCESESGRTRVELYFHGGQSYMLALAAAAPEAAAPFDPVAVGALDAGKTRPLGIEEWDFELVSPNALPLAFWRVEQQAQGHGEPRLRWTSRFHARELPPDLMLAVDGAPALALDSGREPLLSVNRRPVGDWTRGSWLDGRIWTAPLAGLVRKGENQVEYIAEGPDRAAALDEAFYIIGGFSLLKRGGKHKLLAPRKKMPYGDWSKLGYPYYSGAARYSASARIEPPDPGQRVFLLFEGIGDCAEICLNNQRAGLAAWPPYRVEITDLIRPGHNRIEILAANTLHNLFVRRPLPSGLLKSIRLAYVGPDQNKS